MSSFESRMSAYLGGDLAAAARAAFEDEVLADADKAAELAAMVNLDAAIGEALAHGGERHPARRWWQMAAPLAAAAVLVFMLWPGRQDRERTILRGDPWTIRDLTAELATPAGGTVFAWTSYQGAVQYRLEFWPRDGSPAETVMVADTTLAVGQPGYPAISPLGLDWRVTPILPDGREGQASKIFRLAP